MRPRKWFLRFILALLILLVLAPLVLVRARRPSATDYQTKLFQGVAYSRQVYTAPRPMLIHVVEIDLTAPGIAFFVTPGKALTGGMEYRAQTTADFLRDNKVQIGRAHV